MEYLCKEGGQLKNKSSNSSTIGMQEVINISRDSEAKVMSCAQQTCFLFLCPVEKKSTIISQARYQLFLDFVADFWAVEYLA